MVALPSPWLDTPGPTWQFAAAMLRNQQSAMQGRRIEAAENGPAVNDCSLPVRDLTTLCGIFGLPGK
jgi:hypothetical protein